MLQVNNLSTSIGRKEIVHQISFDIKPGEIVGLIGANGAGKTTTMKTILGLTKFTGEIKIDSEKVTEDQHQALARVGALIEHPAIYPFLTGKQNLELYSYSKNDMNHLITALDMNDYIETKAAKYSLGMKQKLGIAIAFLNQPELIILDEPMNGLDIAATIEVRKLIKQYANSGTAFLISSHVLSELQKVMTKAIIISAGTVVMNKKMDEFEQISFQRYRLVTQNNIATKDLLSKLKIDFCDKTDHLLVNQSDIFRVQAELCKHDIYLTEMSPLQPNFEQLVVDILDKQREK
ncbi:ATP-binding cassette domain-containing protein [Lactobacillus sp. ESL0681]|uniref:ABC transporter ATP-binding protein n=1 Tax=Lactobacillus sp. ESL0681 TaxID=2983211 RepID=UPI0023F95D23|nr:ATP-binding cassette domain-containing protein [Lactobacillus sp. ESL0681]WEV39697.1 ATP-binding cassette domain-containing protein [Lactobacillus sp. ESL0681]